MRFRQPWEVWEDKRRNLRWADYAVVLFKRIRLPSERGYSTACRVNILTRGGGLCVYQPFPRKRKKVRAVTLGGLPVYDYYSNPQLMYRWDRIGD